MARTGKVTQRFWGRGRSAWGYTYQDPAGRQVREFHEEWTKLDADQAMAARKLGLVSDQPTAVATTPGMTFGQASARYLVMKAKKRSLHHDRLHLERLKRAFGADTPLLAITAARISDYKEARLGSTVNRESGPRAYCGRDAQSGTGGATASDEAGRGGVGGYPEGAEDSAREGARGSHPLAGVG